MNKSRVALVMCHSYDDEEVYLVVEKGLGLLGGIDRFVKSGEKILLKPNVLIGSHPDSCVTTHPSVLKAVGRIFKEAGAVVYYGDSPAFGKLVASAKRAGLQQVGDEMGLVLADFDKGREVHSSNGSLMKYFTLANGVLGADGLIGLPKFKTHGITRFTGAVKNLFGCIPGLLKSQYHVKLLDPYDFSAMLVDLNMLIKPRLHIMDGIMAMEGNGPRSGKPRKMKVLLFSTDPVALDATACRMIGLDPEFVPTSRAGEKAGLGNYREENIELVGEPFEGFVDGDFKVVRSPVIRCSSSGLRNFLKNQICERPIIDKSRCTKCGMCVEMCPVSPKAVDWRNGNRTVPPRHKYGQCIRCFCCQEICPEGAISIKLPPLRRIVAKRQ